MAQRKVLNFFQSMEHQQRRSSTPKVIPQRGTWANKTEFILSCLGYAIGIGNVWRFPYLCYRNGGGAFLVPYLLMLVLCGIPLFFMETTLGQFSNNGCISIFRICPLLKGAGYAIVIVNVISTTYYNVIISLPLAFIYNCISAKLPWEDCNNPWNTDQCFKLNASAVPENLFNSSLKNELNGTIPKRLKTPADEFFHNHILQISEGIDSIGGLVGHIVLGDFISWIIIYFCIMNGVKSIGKVVYFTATFPFIILFVLFVRGITLPGAIDGIIFYIYPEWNQLLNLKTWADAAIQIFFSLGPGWGGIVNMASYNEFKNNNKGDSMLVPIVNCGTSIFAGFVVFSVLGFMAHETGLPVSSVATGGPGLAFVTYPEAISMLPFPHFWAILFFSMLYLLGMDSMFVQIEAIISSVLDEYPYLRSKKQTVALLSVFVMFLGSLACATNGGMYIIQLLDWYSASISVILICLVEVFVVGWTYGVKNFIRDLEFMIEDRVHCWWPLCWKYITPIILSFIFVTTIVFNTRITYNGVVYPDWSISVGWGTCIISMVWIPLYAIYKLMRTPGSFMQRMETQLKASPDWGPSQHEDRKRWMLLKQNEESKPLHLDQL